jgi:hypothetical protein
MEGCIVLVITHAERKQGAVLSETGRIQASGAEKIE